MAAVLRIMVTAVGDEPIIPCHFHPSDPRFSDLLQTTFHELVRQSYIETTGERPPVYRLTPEGWLEGLRQLGELEGQRIHERATAIVNALKARIKGRHSEEHLDVEALANEIGIPVGWVWNALESNLLERLFPERGFDGVLDGRLIRIPRTFGMPPLDEPDEDAL